MSDVPGKEEEDSSLRTYRKLRTASIVCGTFVAIEFVGGYVSGSLAVFSDAVHLATDLLAFLIAMMASRYASRRESKTFNYGYRRLESLAALCSVCSLVVVTLWLLWQSVVRFLGSTVLHRNQGNSGNGNSHSHSHIHSNGNAREGSVSDDAGYNGLAYGDEEFEFVINGAVMSGTAALGVLVNIVLALVLKENHVHLPGAQCNGDHSSGDGGACGPNCNHSLGGGFGTSSKRVGKVLKDETVAGDKTSGGNNNNNNNNNIDTTSKPRKSIKPFELVSMDLMGCRPCAPLPINGIITKPGGAAKLSPTTIANQFDFVRKRQPTQPKLEPIEIEIGSATESETDDDEYDDENYDSDDVEARPLKPQKSSSSSSPTKPQTIKLREMVNVNLSAAYLHALTDLIQSVLVLVTGIIIWYKPHWHWLDPLLTVCFSVLVLLSSRPIFQRAIAVLLDTCPFEDEADYDTVREVIHRVVSMFSSSASIIKVCCLRIWSVSDGRIGLTCHITRQTKNNNNNNNSSSSSSTKGNNKTGTAVVLKDIVRTLEKDFGIDGKYVTIQIVDSQSSRCASCGVL